MTRGTTPTLVFDVEEDLTGRGIVVLTIRDNMGNQLDLSEPQLTVTEDALTVTLTQEQTISLHGSYVECQYRACMSDGSNATASDKVTLSLAQILKEGVLNGV